MTTFNCKGGARTLAGLLCLGAAHCLIRVPKDSARCWHGRTISARRPSAAPVQCVVCSPSQTVAGAVGTRETQARSSCSPNATTICSKVLLWMNLGKEPLVQTFCRFRRPAFAGSSPPVLAFLASAWVLYFSTAYSIGWANAMNTKLYTILDEFSL